MSAPSSRPPRASFQPRTALGLIYIIVFFAIYCVVLVLPQLLHVLQNVPVGPEQERVAAQLAQEAIQGRLWLALALAVATTALGIAKSWLPGIRPPS